MRWVLSTTRPAKLSDVASAAGVSVTTVSRFMNGRIQLPESTERRIRQAIEATAYRPNPHARRLSTGRSDTIGLVVPDVANPFFARFAAAVEAEADARGLQVSLFVTLNRPGRERVYLEALARNQVDGLIFATNHGDHAELGPMRAVARRLVVVDEDVPGVEAPRLFCDNVAGGCAAGEHLAGLGHVRVAYFGAGPEMMSGRRRLAGLRAGLGPAGRVETFFCAYTREGGASAARELLRRARDVTAVFLAADEIAVGALGELRAAGVRVPADLSLVGFDDVGPLHLFDPPITAVRQPIEEMGRRAVEILAAPPDGPEPPGETLLPVTLIRRASCAPPAQTHQQRGTT